MRKELRFFECFSRLQLPPALRLKLLEAVVTAAVIRREERALSCEVTLSQPLTEGELEAVKGHLLESYGLKSAEIAASLREPAAPKPARSAAAAREGGAVLMGKSVRGKAAAMAELDLKMGQVTVAGRVFSLSCGPTRRPGLWRLHLEMTDESGSLAVHKNLAEQEGLSLERKLKVGQYLLVQGRLELSWDGKEVQLNPVNIQVCASPQREDTAPQKRVELHLHTKMSNMDALTDVRAAVETAIRWGHPAIAITDHGVAQSFPEAWHAAGDRIKLIYGMEGYFLNDLDDRIAVHGEQDAPLDGPIVCFDIETTGLDPQRDRITEIGAVVLEGGKVTDTFRTFADPACRLPQKIVGLTGITDEMLRGAPSQKEALAAFLRFADGRPLAAHNAEFDVSFIRLGCGREGLTFESTYVDSLILAQNLLPELKNHKLDTVAGHLALPEFQHHRAEDDAAAVAHMLIPFWEKLRGQGIATLQAVNPHMDTLRPRSQKRNRHPRHIILLARNKTGLKNLYHLISDSNLKHFKKVPIIPKSDLVRRREGLLIGSACEAGEVFQAVAAHKDWAELKRIAAFYDYLEIQPVCNNAFMIRRGLAADEEALREMNRTIVRLGEELGKPVCATGDVHFLEPQDEVYRRILLSAKKYEDANAPLPIYFKTTGEMLEEFAYLGPEKAREVVVENPQWVAEQVERFPLLPEGLFPPRLPNAREDLERLVQERVRALYGDAPPDRITDRLRGELGGILGKYDVVYMSAQKLVQRSLENGYLVGSRGSVGSSLAAYMAGITEVNALPPHYRCPSCRRSEFVTDGRFGCGADMPDKDCPHCGTPYVKDGFDIPFETFLGFENDNDKVPDIDLNFSGEYQARAHRHAIEMFGEKQVFRAGTVGTLAEKTAYGFVKKYLEENGMTVSRAEENRLTLGCVGVRRTTGQHPGGLVVVPDDMEMEDFCPVQHPADDDGSDTVTTHFEYHSMEDNLLKLDMLGHDDPTMVRMMQDLTGVDPRTIPLDDRDTMSIFTSSAVLGYENDEILGPTGAVAIPEFNTRFTRQMLVDTKPKNFNTLVRLSGFSHGTDVWLGNARDLILSGTAGVLETVGCRDDIMLYLIGRGLDPKMSFQIMEDVRKGKVKKAGFKDGWVEAMREHGVPEWYIESLAKIGYLFPKAHAVAYVMMAFRIAWYKVHHPLAFYATFFTVRAKAFDAEYCCAGLEAVKRKIREIEQNKDATAVEQNLLTTLEVCYEFYLRGFHFETIDIYKSDATRFIVTEKGLLPPFISVHGLGDAAAIDTAEKRQGRSFVSIEEFSMCCDKLTRTHIQQLKDLGAFAGMADSSQMSLF